MKGAVFWSMVAAAFIPAPGITEDRVDVIMLNHFFQEVEPGVLEPVFDQWVFWELREGQLVVRDWRLVRRPFVLECSGGLWRLVFMDRGTFRRVAAGALIETWTLEDPEVLHQRIMPREMRSGLTPGADPRALARREWWLEN